MPRSFPSGAALAVSLSLIAPALAHAHAVCGDRVFPPTLTLDDPGFNDELSLPTIQYTPIPANGGNPSGHSTDYAFEWDKTIIPNAGIAINGDYLIQRGAGQNLAGSDNITITAKGQLPCLEDHELLVSLGVAREFARTGSPSLRAAGAIDTVSNTTPMIYIGKGMGDLPVDYLRPFAITAVIGRRFSDDTSASPNQWNYSASLQYSMPYMQQHVKALDIPEVFTHLIPLVEFAYSRPTGGPTTGTISPGLLYEADSWQIGAEAVIPANGTSRQTRGTGFIVQFHLFLDDVLPDSLGKPLFNF